MRELISLNREMENTCVDVVLLAALFRLHPFEFPLDKWMAAELDGIAQNVHHLINAIACATNGAFSEDLMAGRIEKLRPASNRDAVYTKEQIVALLALFAVGIEDTLKSCGIFDYIAQYPEYCRVVLCCLYDKLVAGILWWYCNPASTGLPNAGTVTYLNNIWSAFGAMCGPKVSLTNDENVVAQSVRCWLESDLVANQLIEGGENTGKLREVVTALQEIIS